MTQGTGQSAAVAEAHPNIALAKYWGKLAEGPNLPAVPSLSLTLAGMVTRTAVRLDPSLAGDELTLDGEPAQGRAVQRVSQLLDLVWRRSDDRQQPRPAAVVESTNDFPTAAGLASSASAFAALAVAANAALGAERSVEELSSMARQVSASAGRSLFGGFVELPAGRAGDDWLPARPLAPADHWELRLLVAVTAVGPKAVGSTEGMIRTAGTSPFYDAWVGWAAESFHRIRQAVLARDLASLGPAAERSALCMHGAALAAEPPLVYWNGATVEVQAAVRRLRAAGADAYFTIDAGPHVKIITTADQAEQVAAEVAGVSGVHRVIVTRPGGPARLLTEGVGGR
ncbi:MAG: diphosphomevalonate decarboxylase [Deltaproteobacteria bacterium]|nr:diphosphomevalonate decarboxylase [Deltaproteobacteria bacterium]